MRNVFLVILTLIIGELSSQNLAWIETTGSPLNERSHAIAVDALGNSYTVGGFQDTVDFDPGVGVYNLSSAGDYDIFILKLSAQGNFIWAKRIGDVAQDEALGISIDKSGKIYVCGLYTYLVDFDPGSGTHNLQSANMNDGFVLRLDTAGNFVWAESMHSNSVSLATSLSVNKKENILVTGQYDGTAHFNWPMGVNNFPSYGPSGSNTAAFFLNLDTLGSLVWAKSIGSSGYGSVLGVSLTTDQAMNIYVGGEFGSVVDFDPGVGVDTVNSGQHPGAYILKLDSLGNFVWAKTMLGGIAEDFKIAVDNFQNVYSSGMFTDVVDFDPGVGVHNLTITHPGSYLFDGFIQKLDQAGNFVWVNQIKGNGNDVANSIKLDSLNNIYVSGYFGDTVDFDFGPGVTDLISGSNNSGFLLKLDNTGNYIWAIGIQGANGSSYSGSFDWDAAGNIYVAGSFYVTCDFDPGIGIVNQTSNGGSDLFIQKLNPIGLSVKSFPSNLSMKLFPNPNNGAFILRSDKSEKLKVDVYSSFGNLVANYEFTNQTMIPIKLDQPSGVYFIRTTDQEGKTSVLKTIVQD